MREKTNSITHLVKIVAKEVLEEHGVLTMRLNARVLELERAIGNLNLKIGTSLHEANDLYQQLYQVQRSIGAIKARINQKDLI